MSELTPNPLTLTGPGSSVVVTLSIPKHGSRMALGGISVIEIEFL